MDIFNSFFFWRFSWTVYFVRHFSYPLRKASKICPAIPRQFSRYSSDGQVDSKILARYWTLSVHYNTLLCFPFTRDGRFLFQLFHLPMRFDCRKTSVLEREGETYLRHKCNPVTFPWNRPYFVRKICISLRPFFHHKIPLFQQYLDTDEELGLLMVDSVLILLSLTMQTFLWLL